MLWLTRWYRIYCEGVDPQWIRLLLSDRFPQGSYKLLTVGDSGRDLIVELYSGERDQIELLCRKIAERNHGQRVLLSESSPLKNSVCA